MNEIETLKLNYEFKNVFNKGKYFIGKQVIVYVYKNKKKQNRIGIAISSKMFNAVKRNHIKRLIREAYRFSDFGNITGYDIVFTWNKKCKYDDASYYDILDDLNKMVSKSGL